MRGIKKIVKPIDVNLPARAEWTYIGDKKGAAIYIKVGELSKHQRDILRHTLTRGLRDKFSDFVKNIRLETSHRIYGMKYYGNYTELCIQLWNNYGDVTEEQLFDVIKTTSEIIETALVEVEYEFTLPLPKDTKNSTWPPKMRA